MGSSDTFASCHTNPLGSHVDLTIVGGWDADTGGPSLLSPSSNLYVNPLMVDNDNNLMLNHRRDGGVGGGVPEEEEEDEPEVEEEEEEEEEDDCSRHYLIDFSPKCSPATNAQRRCRARSTPCRKTPPSATMSLGLGLRGLAAATVGTSLNDITNGIDDDCDRSASRASLSIMNRSPSSLKSSKRPRFSQVINTYYKVKFIFISYHLIGCYSASQVKVVVCPACRSP